jgi:AcrR family transcriptional regulator
VLTAYALFSEHGLQAVGVDRIIAEAGVAKTTLYRHFPSKDALAVAAIDHHRQVWTRDWLQRTIADGGGTPVEQLLAIFDALEHWFGDPAYQGCFFVNVLVERHDRDTAVGAAAVAGLAEVREWLRDLTERAGAIDPDGLALHLQMLMLGAILATSAGYPDAAARARDAAALMLGAWRT